MSKIKKILLVEDDRFISELYARSLRKNGFEVDEVVTGPKGLTMAKSGKYDLVLLDIMIPDMSGIDVLKELRGDDNQLKDTKIVIATNVDLDDETRQALEEKADGYLIKADVTPRRMLEIIKQIEDFGAVPNAHPEEE